MEWKDPFLGLVAAFGFLIWAIEFWRILKRPELPLPSQFGISQKFKIFKLSYFLLGVLAWIFLAMALMGPRKALKFERNKVEANDIFFVVDVSRSMLAEDFKPNRLEAAKEKIREFVKLRPKDRIGIVIFAEKAFTLLPLTMDLKLIDQLINEIKVGFLGSGTNIGDALALGVARLGQTDSKNKVLIFLTDGVSNVGNMTPAQAAEEAKKQKVKAYTIGIGGDQNARIPIGQGIFGMRYQNIPGGSIDVKTLEMIAKTTGAKSYIAKDINALKDVFDEIQSLEKTEIESSSRVVYEELFARYALIGVLALTLVEIMRRFHLREVA